MKQNISPESVSLLHLFLSRLLMYERDKVKYLKTAVSAICLMLFTMTMITATLIAQLLRFIASVMTVDEQRPARHLSAKTLTLIRTV